MEVLLCLRYDRVIMFLMQYEETPASHAEQCFLHIQVGESWLSIRMANKLQQNTEVAVHALTQQ